MASGKGYEILKENTEDSNESTSNSGSSSEYLSASAGSAEYFTGSSEYLATSAGSTDYFTASCSPKANDAKEPLRSTKSSPAALQHTNYLSRRSAGTSKKILQLVLRSPPKSSAQEVASSVSSSYEEEQRSGENRNGNGQEVSTSFSGRHRNDNEQGVSTSFSGRHRNGNEQGVSTSFSGGHRNSKGQEVSTSFRGEHRNSYEQEVSTSTSGEHRNGYEQEVTSSSSGDFHNNECEPLIAGEHRNINQAGESRIKCCSPYQLMNCYLNCVHKIGRSWYIYIFQALVGLVCASAIVMGIIFFRTCEGKFPATNPFFSIMMGIFGLFLVYMWLVKVCRERQGERFWNFQKNRLIIIVIVALFFATLEFLFFAQMTPKNDLQTGREVKCPKTYYYYLYYMHILNGGFLALAALLYLPDFLIYTCRHRRVLPTNHNGHYQPL